MKLTVQSVEFEGTPDELLQAQLSHLFNGRDRSGEEPRLGNGNGDTHNGLPRHVWEWLNEEMPVGEPREIAAALMADVLDWDDVEAARGTGMGRRYMRLYRRGAPAGAFAYVQPRKIHFRLPGAAADGRRFARARGVQEHNPHQVAVTTISRDSLPEIVELTRAAFEHAAE